MSGSLERPTDYRGEEAIRVSATQDDDLTATQARKLVAEWMEFFASGPLTFTHLGFVTRTPRRLFETLSQQTQSEQLKVNWGDCKDYTPMLGLPNLTDAWAMECRSMHPPIRVLAAQVRGWNDFSP